MLFSSTTFLFLFLPALLALYYLPRCAGRRWRNGVLLAFSLGSTPGVSRCSCS
ncbi:MAG: hypothetical protein Q4A07_09960 [Coriobacteriales bacterium]|nr:hypothetical protein [Coriobacteriales bacterium]